MKTEYQKSYWNNQGRFEAAAKALQKLVPSSGPCSKMSPKLEKFRVASNCVYDLFNNGLCNRAAEFRGVFGFSAQARYPKWRAGHRSIDFQNEDMNLRINVKMDAIIVEAAYENGLAYLLHPVSTPEQEYTI